MSETHEPAHGSTDPIPVRDARAPGGRPPRPVPEDTPPTDPGSPPLTLESWLAAVPPEVLPAAAGPTTPESPPSSGRGDEDPLAWFDAEAPPEGVPAAAGAAPAVPPFDPAVWDAPPPASIPVTIVGTVPFAQRYTVTVPNPDFAQTPRTTVDPVGAGDATPAAEMAPQADAAEPLDSAGALAGGTAPTEATDAREPAGNPEPADVPQTIVDTVPTWLPSDSDESPASAEFSAPTETPAPTEPPLAESATEWGATAAPPAAPPPPEPEWATTYEPATIPATIVDTVPPALRPMADDDAAGLLPALGHPGPEHAFDLPADADEPRLAGPATAFVEFAASPTGPAEPSSVGEDPPSTDFVVATEGSPSAADALDAELAGDSLPPIVDDPATGATEFTPPPPPTDELEPPFADAAPVAADAAPALVEAEPSSVELGATPQEADVTVPLAAVAAGALVTSAASPDTVAMSTATETFAHAHDDVEHRTGLLSYGLITKLGGVVGFAGCAVGMLVLLVALAGLAPLTSDGLLNLNRNVVRWVAVGFGGLLVLQAAGAVLFKGGWAGVVKTAVATAVSGALYVAIQQFHDHEQVKGFNALLYSNYVVFAGLVGFALAVLGGLIEHRRLRQETAVLAAVFVSLLTFLGGYALWLIAHPGLFNPFLDIPFLSGR